MPRGPRLIFDDAVLHIINRGIARSPLFRCEEDFMIFLELIKRYKKEIGFCLFHYVLMKNHIHLLLKINKAKDLARLIKSLTLSYTSRHHFKYKTSGYLWQGRYKSMLIGDDSYLLECGCYIERNPVKAGIVKDPADYPWTSYRTYAYGEENSIIDLNPAYLALSDDIETRRKIYIEYVLSSREKRYVFKDLSILGSEDSKAKIQETLRKERYLGRKRVNNKIEALPIAV